MAEKYPEPLLDLTSLIERPKILIDGDTHEMASPEELSVIEIQQVASLGRRLDQQLKQDGAAQGKVISDTLNAIIAIVLAPVPEAVRAKLSDPNKLSVIEVFTMLSHARKTQLAGATIPQIVKALMAGLAGNTPATGAKPSPGSSGSTAAIPVAG